MQKIIAAPIFVLKRYGVAKAADVKDLARWIENPYGRLQNRDGKEFKEQLRTWQHMRTAFPKLLSFLEKEGQAVLDRVNNGGSFGCTC